jgi:multidrug efflux system membrane fusion protein
VDESTGTVRVRVRVDNEDGRFWPGRFVRVRIVLATLPKAILVPATAPQVSAFGPFVYVVKDDPKSPSQKSAEMRPVVLGQRHGDLVAIASGLTAGEVVVTEGQLGVWPGAPVVVAAPPAQGTQQP